MPVTDRDRHDLFLAAQQALGDGPADVLMAMLPPVGWADVATRTEMLAHFDQVDARFKQVDAHFDQMDARFDQVDARFDQVDARFDQVDARFDQVDARFDKMEAKIAGLLPTYLAVNIASMFGVAGLVLAALKVA